MPRAHLAMFGDTLLVTAGIQRVEARVVAEHPAMHRTAPETKRYLWPQMSVVLRKL